MNSRIVFPAGSQLGFKVAIQSIPSPRKESEEHHYNPAHTGLLSLGPKPNYLSDEILIDIFKIVLKHKNKIDPRKLFADR
jgi:UDP-sulfoquinovose synthase